MHLSALTRYPVKSMAGERVATADVGTRGLEHDRWWALRTADGGVASGKTTRRFRRVDGLLHWSARMTGALPRVTAPDGRSWTAGDPELDAALTAACGRPLAVRTEADVPHHDDAPVHVLTTASVRALGRAVGADLDPRRFRANLLLDVPGVGYAEDAWSGRLLAVGGVVLRLTEPMPRCVMVNADQPGLARDGRVLRALGPRDLALGLMAEVVTPGTVADGDVAELC